MTTQPDMSYKTSQLYDYDTLNIEDLSIIAGLLEDFSNAAASKIEKTPAIQSAFDALFAPPEGKKTGLLTEAYTSAAMDHCIKYAATIEKSFKEFNPEQRRNLQKQACIEHILYIDLYAKLLSGDSHQTGQSPILSMPMLSELLPAEVKDKEAQALCRELGAHNIAQIASFKGCALH